MRKYEVFHRRQGYPNANIYSIEIEANNIEEARMFAYMYIDEDRTIVDIVDVTLEEKPIKVKSWFIDKVQREAIKYHTDIIVDRNEDGTPDIDDNKCNVVYAIKIGETDKAIKVTLATGQVLENYKGWTTWIPKSLVM